MARRFDPIYIGLKGAVLALDRDSGQIVWRTELKGRDFVNVVATLPGAQPESVWAVPSFS